MSGEKVKGMMKKRNEVIISFWFNGRSFISMKVSFLGENEFYFFLCYLTDDIV